eukprot:COSAG01_NODE_48742_length_378_cov_1.200717_1_plen_42_part_01
MHQRTSVFDAGQQATPSPPSVSVASAGIDPSQDGQSGISEIG